MEKKSYTNVLRYLNFSTSHSSQQTHGHGYSLALKHSHRNIFCVIKYLDTSLKCDLKNNRTVTIGVLLLYLTSVPASPRTYDPGIRDHQDETTYCEVQHPADTTITGIQSYCLELCSALYYWLYHRSVIIKLNGQKLETHLSPLQNPIYESYSLSDNHNPECQTSLRGYQGLWD